MGEDVLPAADRGSVGAGPADVGVEETPEPLPVAALQGSKRLSRHVHGKNVISPLALGEGGAACDTFRGRVDQEEIIRYVTETFTGVMVLRPEEGPGAGDTFFYYDPESDVDLTREMPFATIVTKDYGEFDNASRLDRPGVFRLNVGLSRESFRSLFGSPDESKGHDYAALDRLMPHPVYATQSWVSVLNPSPETFETVKPLLAEAYSRATKRRAARQSRGD